jgi:hypothetical protein
MPSTAKQALSDFSAASESAGKTINAMESMTGRIVNSFR